MLTKILYPMLIIIGFFILLFCIIWTIEVIKEGIKERKEKLL